MARIRPLIVLDGGDICATELNIAYAEAARADDYVFAELFKLAPFDGTNYAKGIVPHQVRGQNGAFITPGPIVATPIVITAFRAFIGSRIYPSGSPSPAPPNGIGDPVITTGREANLRDIRSAVWVGVQSDGTLGYAVPAAAFVPNSSGNPRWDRICAKVYVDQPLGGTPEILVKPTGSGVTAPQAASPQQLTMVGSPDMTPTDAIVVVTGTAAANPALPPAPTDIAGAGVFYITLGYVAIPTGFVPGTSAIAASQINIDAPVLEIAEILGGHATGPMSEATGAAAATASTSTSSTVSWGTACQRPGFALPRSMKGGVKKTLLMPAVNSAATAAPFGNGSVVDKSIDWRKRYFKVQAFAGQAGFASDPAISGGFGLPLAGIALGARSQTYIQPLVVASGNLTPLGSGFVPTASNTTYYLQCTNLQNGATIEDVTLSMFIPTSFAGAGCGIQLCKGLTGAPFGFIGPDVAPNRQTIGGASGSISATGPGVITVSVTGLTDVIDTTTYVYWLEFTSPTSGPLPTLAPFALTLLTQSSPYAVSGGQSWENDATLLTGGALSNAGFAGLFTPANIPIMGAGSAIGLYVDLATGFLDAYYVGTPGVNFLFDVEATGAGDNT